MRINHWLLVLYLPIFILEKGYSQNDEIGVLEVQEIKVFVAAQP